MGARGVFCRNVKKYTRILHFSEPGGPGGPVGIKVYAGAGWEGCFGWEGWLGRLVGKVG